MDYFKLKLKDKSAQDMVEFTFVLPLLLFCFVFILTGGQMVYNKFSAFQAAYDGTRKASVATSATKGSKALEEVAKTFEPQTIAVEEIKTQLYYIDDWNIFNGEDQLVKANSLGGMLTGGWQKGKIIVGEVNYTMKTLFPINFIGYAGQADLSVANTVNVSARTAAVIEYNKVNRY